MKAAPLAGVGVILATAVDPARFPVDARAGIGSAQSTERSWWQARTALRFAGPREPVVRYADLGSLALLAEIPRDTARANPDVAAVIRLSGNPQDMETLDAYCAL
ncbi:hypothetical protein [Streptomyces sp. PvR034]|uniref:hypothetical protein n=1 Tax=Streptomyces sp. PvR034 TaxID=3156401 RepID=UPI0033924B80